MVLPPGKAWRLDSPCILLLIKKGNRHVDLHKAMDPCRAEIFSPDDSSTNYVRRREATRMPTDIRFCRANILHAIRYVTMISAVSAVQPWGDTNCQWPSGISFTRTVAPQIEGVYGYGNTIRRTLELLEAPYQLAYHLQL